MDHTQRDHIHSVLVASEEKLVDKMNDKDDLLRRLMGELAECRTALEEQSHKLELSNMSLDASRQQAAGGARQIEEAAAQRLQMDDAQRELVARVRELEKSEAVLTTRLAGVEADRDQLSGTESVPAVTFPAADTHTGGQRSVEWGGDTAQGRAGWKSTSRERTAGETRTG